MQAVKRDLPVSNATTSQVPVHIVNHVGSETNSIRDSIPIDKNSSFDEKIPEAKQEPIAIVGMAVNMPGASNVGQLWEILVNGTNTVEEVRFFFLSLNYDCWTGNDI